MFTLQSLLYAGHHGNVFDIGLRLDFREFLQRNIAQNKPIFVPDSCNLYKSHVVMNFVIDTIADYNWGKSSQFEWAAPAILFACLVFTLTAPTYVWTILGM